MGIGDVEDAEEESKEQILPKREIEVFEDKAFSNSVIFSD